MIRWEALHAPSGLPCARAAPDAARGGVALLADAAWPSVSATLAERLFEAGFALVVPELGWRMGETGVATGRVPDDLADSEVVLDVGQARRMLPPGPCFVVGVGRAGIYARLAACAVFGLRGAASLGGRVWYSGVSPRRPIQPLDLLPGLACALQCHFDADDPDVPAAHVDELERRLQGVGCAAQVLRYPADERIDGPGREMAAARVRAFLLHLVADAP